MRSAPQALVALVKQAVEVKGLELVGVQLLAGQGGPGLLRVYIDKDDGIQLSDCEAVSHQLSGVLDVEDPIAGEYNLEVSSPGLDRPLFELDHFERFQGHRARVKLRVPRNGRKVFTGMIEAVQDGTIVLVVDGESFDLPYQDIDSARLAPESELKTHR